MQYTFGKYVEIEIESLRNAMGRAAFSRALKQYGVKPRTVHALEDGTWITLNQNVLLLLLALAKEHGLPSAVRIIESPLWSTFRQRQGNVVLAGQDKYNNHFRSDFELPAVLAGSIGVKCGFRDVPLTVKPRIVTDLIRTSNLLIVGSSKNNVATDIALKAMWPKATPPIKFLMPEVRYEGVTVSESPNGVRALQVDNRIEEENVARRLGVVVICRDPLNSKGVTTLIVAGCSSEATELMIQEFRQAALYRAYSHVHARSRGKAAILLFDSSKRLRGRWTVYGHKVEPRKPGRPLSARPQP